MAESICRKKLVMWFLRYDAHSLASLKTCRCVGIWGQIMNRVSSWGWCDGLLLLFIVIDDVANAEKPSQCSCCSSFCTAPQHVCHHVNMNIVVGFLLSWLSVSTTRKIVKNELTALGLSYCKLFVDFSLCRWWLGQMFLYTTLIVLSMLTCVTCNLSITPCSKEQHEHQ